MTTGAQQGISLCAGLYLQRGDSALVEDPAYFGVLDAFRAAGARIGGVALDAHGVPPATLRQRIIATVISSRLSDTHVPEPYRRPDAQCRAQRSGPHGCRPGRTHHRRLHIVRPGSRRLFSASHRGLRCRRASDHLGSLSKLIWPGLRIGWVRAPEAIVEKLARCKSAIDLGCPLLTQAIAVRLLGRDRNRPQAAAAATEAPARPACGSLARTPARVAVPAVIGRFVFVGETAERRCPRARPDGLAAWRGHSSRSADVGNRAVRWLRSNSLHRRTGGAAHGRPPACRCVARLLVGPARATTMVEQRLGMV